MKLRLGDVVLIEWEDHYSKNNGWVSVHKKEKLDRYYVKSVGVITKLNKRQVQLAQQWHVPSDTAYATYVADFMTILRNNIIKVNVIKKKAIKV